LDARLVAIQFGPREIYRFMFLNPPGRSRSLRDPFRRVTFSFRRLSEQEANDVVPLTIEILRVGPRDTVQSLASGLPFEDFQIDRFLVLNGLQPGEFLSPGTRIKIIAE
jgi:predicted Zn-dependent protease